MGGGGDALRGGDHDILSSQLIGGKSGGFFLKELGVVLGFTAVQK